MLNRQELLDHYRSSREAFLAALEGLTPKQLIDPSVDGWSVKDNILHLATWDEIRAAEVERISAGFATAWPMNDEQDHIFNEMSYELRKGLSLEQAMWELQQSRARLLSAIEQPLMRAYRRSDTVRPDCSPIMSLSTSAGFVTGAASSAYSCPALLPEDLF